MEARWDRESQAGGGKGLAGGFKGGGWEAERQAKHAADGTTKRMTRKPDIRVGVDFCDVSVKLGGGLIVPIFLSQSPNEAGLVAGEGGGGAVADLFPKVVASLSAAAAEKEVVVDLILGGGAGAVEDCRGGTFKRDDDGSVISVGKYMAPKAIALPTEAIRVVKACVDVFPFACAFLLVIGVCCHGGEVDNGFFIGYVRGRNMIESPGRGC